jgi:hypothetical protein
VDPYPLSELLFAMPGTHLKLVHGFTDRHLILTTLNMSGMLNPYIHSGYLTPGRIDKIFRTN